jgi:hypothetical protein
LSENMWTCERENVWKQSVNVRKFWFYISILSILRKSGVLPREGFCPCHARASALAAALQIYIVIKPYFHLYFN